VAVARALVSRPRALLLDEPTSSLDARLREELRTELTLLARESGATTLLVTHDREDALMIADRIAVLHAGKLEQVAAPRELYDRPATAFVAELIGSARSLPARALGGDAVQLPGGEVLPAEVVGAAAGAPVVLCIRADQVRIGEGPAQAEVIAAAFLGDRVALELRVGDTTLAASVDPASPPARGSRVRFTLRGARAFPG
jgi:putative spermidine/putrescine transport system ATP-binding protein